MVLNHFFVILKELVAGEVSVVTRVRQAWAVQCAVRYELFTANNQGQSSLCLCLLKPSPLFEIIRTECMTVSLDIMLP